MDLIALEWLNRIEARHGLETGKIIQQLVGIALCRADYQVEDRAIQGVDLETVTLAKKDFMALASRVVDGYTPLVAAWRRKVLDDWVVAEASRLAPGTFGLARLRSLRCQSLQDEVNRFFPSVVETHGPTIAAERKGKGLACATRLFNAECWKREGGRRG